MLIFAKNVNVIEVCMQSNAAYGLWSFSSVLIAQNVKTTHKNLASRHRYWRREREGEEKKTQSLAGCYAHIQSQSTYILKPNRMINSTCSMRESELAKAAKLVFLLSKANFNEPNSMKNLVSPFHLATRWLCDLCASAPAVLLFSPMRNRFMIFIINIHTQNFV